MKKQKIRFYAALLCSSMVLSLVSTPVSAAETGQLTNPPTSTEGPGSPESASGNEAAAVLNGLSVSALTANRVAEVTTAEHLTDMLADSSVVKITLAENIDIGSTLTVNRTVTLDLNGNVLKMNGSGSVIKVESGGNLTIQDSNTSTPHKFTPGGDGLWGLDETGGSEIVYGGIITGGNTPNGGGVYVATGCQLTMTGGNIVGCLATYEGGGVYIDGLRGSSDQTVFTMTGGSITGCQANGTDGGGGVNVTKGTFTMKGGSIIACTVIEPVYNTTVCGGGVHIRNGGSFTMSSGTIRDCRCIGDGGGVYVGTGQFTMEGGNITGCQALSGSFGRGGGVYNLGTFTMIGGIIEDDCTASGSGGGVYNAKVLFANGGEIAGNVMNGDRHPSGTITGSGGTRFSGKVINNKNEDGNKSIIECGTFTGEVSNKGEILGGDFSQANLSGTLVITFDPDNGEPSSTKEVHLDSDGAALTPPDPTPTKEGYILDGWYWYYNNNGTETKWNFDTDKARYTMTLKAKWAFCVTLYPNDGTIASGKEVTGYTYGTGATLPTANDMTREGYRFDGWYADSNFSGSPVTEITGTDTGNKTFYAKWTKNTTPIISGNTINYIVEHYKTDGSGYTLAETEHSAGKTGDTVTATPKTYEGFTYNPAISTASGTLKKISSLEDIVTLKLYYDVNADTEQESTDSGSEEKADRENPSPVVKNTTSYMTYTVQAGDTLWAIARKYNCSITEIVAANSDRIKNPNRIHAGWQLKIPQSGAPITGGTPDAVLPENKKSGIYIVRQGDTLWAIARKCGCSVAEIVSLNRELIRNPALIYSGWELKVPQD